MLGTTAMRRDVGEKPCYGQRGARDALPAPRPIHARRSWPQPESSPVSFFASLLARTPEAPCHPFYRWIHRLPHFSRVRGGWHGCRFGGAAPSASRAARASGGDGAPSITHRRFHKFFKFFPLFSRETSVTRGRGDKGKTDRTPPSQSSPFHFQTGRKARPGRAPPPSVKYFITKTIL